MVVHLTPTCYTGGQTEIVMRTPVSEAAKKALAERIAAYSKARSEARARRRAGWQCAVCGTSLKAERSTRLTCSMICRGALHRRRKHERDLARERAKQRDWARLEAKRLDQQRADKEARRNPKQSIRTLAQNARVTQAIAGKALDKARQ